MSLALMNSIARVSSGCGSIFPPRGLNNKPIVMLRNNTAFHYAGLDMGRAVKSLMPDEKAFHIARHPTNTLYWVGSAVVFKTIFAEIAVRAKPTETRTYDQSFADGLQLVFDDVNEANFHLPYVLYGLIEGLLEDALGQPLGAGIVTTIDGLQASRKITLCPWLDAPHVAAVA